MKLTQAFKSWLQENKGVSAEATDEQFREAAAASLADGSLSTEKFVELQEDPDAQRASGIEKQLGAITELLTKQNERIEKLETKPTEKAVETNEQEEPRDYSGVKSKETAPRDEKSFSSTLSAGDEQPSGSPNVDVIAAHKQYDGTKRAVHFPDRTEKGLRHPFAGQRAFEGSQKFGKTFLDEPSDLDLAVCGAWFKWQMSNQLGKQTPPKLRMTDHDKDLMSYAVKEMKWSGVIGGGGSEDDGAIGLKRRKLAPHEQKALIDDGTSGGQEAVPDVFDEAVILTPLLNGEFFPRVEVVPITRGSSVDGASMGNVTLSSGGADNTQISLFSTASFISAFDTTIHVVNGAIEIGLDFLSDTPVDIGGIITQQYGQQLLTWLDTQICVGDGSTEPEGLTVASGTQSVSSDNGAGGPPTVGDYESLLFGVTKPYKAGFPANRICFGGTETSYQRARGIAVGGSDARRVFNMTHEDYMLLNHPYLINEGFTNQQIVFCNLARYRMYRRMGLSVSATTEGKELKRKNLMLIVARARFGGAITDGAACSIITDGQS